MNKLKEGDEIIVNHECGAKTIEEVKVVENDIIKTRVIKSIPESYEKDYKNFSSCLKCTKFCNFNDIDVFELDFSRTKSFFLLSHNRRLILTEKNNEMVIKEYYKNSNTGDIIQKMYVEEIKNSESYFKNGFKCGKEELEGCVPISEKKLRKRLKK